MPGLIRPRAALTLAILQHSARAERPLFLPRAGALSVPLAAPLSWDVCAAAGYRTCGRVAVRFDLVERLAEAIAASAPAEDAALARLVGRPARDLPGMLAALGYQRTAAGAPTRWRLEATKRKRGAPAVGDNAFAALAELMPEPSRSRRRRGART